MTTVLEPPTSVEPTDPDSPVPSSPADLDNVDVSPVPARAPQHGDPAGEFLWLDPHKLVRAPNRDEKPANAKFDASIAAHGNAVPLVTVRTGPDTFEVHDGWHRALSLRKAGRKATAVVLPQDSSATEIELAVDRVVRQFSSGAYRFEYSDKDRYDATRQLLDLKLRHADIAQALPGVSRKEISAVKAVSQAPAVEAAHHDGQLDIFESARAAKEFGDDQDAIDALATAAASGQFEHRFQQMIDARERRAAAERAAAEKRASDERAQANFDAQVAELTSAGFIVVDPLDDDANYAPLEELVTASGQPATVADITSNEHYAVLLVRNVRHKDTGEFIDPELVDELTLLDPEEDAAEELFHADDVVFYEDWVPFYYCLELDEEQLSYPDPRSTDDSDRDDDPDNDDPDMAAARAAERQQHAEAASAEQEQQRRAAAKRAAENKRTTAKNALMRSATKTRRAKVIEHLFNGRKSVPEGSLELIGKVMQHPELLTALHARLLVNTLQGKVPNSPKADSAVARDNHGAMRALLRTVAALEAHIQPHDQSQGGADAWRRPSSLYDEYYAFLQHAFGYQRAEIEKLITGEITENEVLAQTDAPLRGATDDSEIVSDDPGASAEADGADTDDGEYADGSEQDSSADSTQSDTATADEDSAGEQAPGADPDFHH